MDEKQSKIDKKQLLSWLFRYGMMQLPPENWARLVGVEIIDPDGWRGKGDDFKKPIYLVEFIERLSRCTIK